MAQKNSAAKSSPKKKADAPPEKRGYFKQSDFPLVTLQQAQKIASALVDNFGSGAASPPDVALALNISRTSSWPQPTGAAVAYLIASILLSLD